MAKVPGPLGLEKMVTEAGERGCRRVPPDTPNGWDRARHTPGADPAF